MRTIAIVNQKGGCGKTTTAINLAALYAKRGLRTLLVDMDPQSHCAAGLGVPEARIEYSIADALIATHNGFDPSMLVWEVAKNLYLAPSTVMLSALEAPGGGLHQLSDKDRRLESLLHAIGGHYDRCLIDCPPTIGLLTFNALRAARETLIPVETGFFSLRGAEKQWNTIQRMIAHIGRPIACHLLPTLHNPQSQLACNILAALRRQFAGQIIPIVIHEDEALREAASLGQPVQEYAPLSQAKQDFEALADWLEEHAIRPVTEIEVLASANGFGGPAHSATQTHGFGRYETPPTTSRAAELARRVHDLNVKSNPTIASQSASPQTELLTVAAPLNEAVVDESDADCQIPAAQPQVPVYVETAMATAPATAVTPVIRIEEECTPVVHMAAAQCTDLQHLFGVRQTTQGVLFVQPASAAKESVSVVGDFNHWSTSSHRMRFNPDAGVFELLVQIKPGHHLYQLVCDGAWQLDSHNPQQQMNTYGEPNSLLIVR